MPCKKLVFMQENVFTRASSDDKGIHRTWHENVVPIFIVDVTASVNPNDTYKL